MALKYRIVYEDYSRYHKRTILKKLPPYLLSLLCVAFIAYLVSSQDQSKLSELLMPGDPAVTTDAFQQLSEAMDRGEALSDALDVFCETIMGVR